MVENNPNVEKEQVKHKNSLTFEPKVLEKIANYSVSDIEGVLELRGDWTNSVRNFFSSSNEGENTKGVTAEVGKKEVALDIDLIAEYGKDLRKAFDKVVSSVTENVESMTSLNVVEVNVNVTDIMTRAEYDRQQNEKQRQEREQRRQNERDRRDQNRSGQYSDGSRVQ